MFLFLLFEDKHMLSVLVRFSLTLEGVALELRLIESLLQI